jgi:K+ transporter
LTSFGERARRGSSPLDNTFGSAVLVVLLVFEVAAVVAGAETTFFACILAAWFVLPAIVGLKNVLDAGCYFMLVSLGIVVMVDLVKAVPLPT